MTSETTYDFQGDGDVETKTTKFVWDADSATASITTNFKRIVGIALTPFPGTNQYALASDQQSGTFLVTVPIAAHILATNATTLGASWGYSVGTAGTNVLVLQMAGTIADAVTWHARIDGHR